MIQLMPNRVRRAYYGGKNLDKIAGNTHPRTSRFPERWIASVATAFNPDREIENEGLSVTEQGVTLKEIISRDAHKMLGKKQITKNGAQISILLKLLDAAERLVIQVHPTVSFAYENFGCRFGKTECWYMLNSGGSVYIGFKQGITKNKWKALFEAQDVDGMLSMLHEFEVNAGDLVFVDGGIPHAIGANCFMAELQEPTDLMVIPERVTPSGILLPDEKLHCGLGFQKMFDCFKYEGTNRQEAKNRYFVRPKTVSGGAVELVGKDRNDKFTMLKYTVAEEQTIDLHEKYAIIFVLSGRGEIGGCVASRGDEFFAGAYEQRLLCTGPVEFLLCQAN